MTARLTLTYHHVHEDVSYPAIYTYTAESDTRVDPLHAKKMTALLQHVASIKAAKGPILLQVEADAGHGVGKPLHKIVAEQANMWAFLAWQLGLGPSKAAPVYRAVLFGSYAKGNATDKSDVNIVIDSKGELLNINFFGLLEDIRTQLNKRVDLTSPFQPNFLRSLGLASEPYFYRHNYDLIVAARPRRNQN